MRAVGETQRARRAGDLLPRDCVREIAEARAAPTVGHRDTQQPLRTELRPEVAWKFIRAIDFRRTRRNPFLREAAHLRADLFEIRAQTEVTVADVDGVHELAFPFITIV